MVGELDAKAIVYRSAHIPSGLDGRLARAGAAVLRAIDDSGQVTDALETLDLCRAHRESDRLTHRLEALEMAIRLVRYLGVPTHSDPVSLADAASTYAAN